MFYFSWSYVSMSKRSIKGFLNTKTTFFDGFFRCISPTKALANTLVTKLLTMRYDDHSSIMGHIMQMIDITNKLKSMEISDGFLVLFIFNFFPAQYDKASENKGYKTHANYQSKGTTTPKNCRKERNYNFCKKKENLKINCLKYKKWLENKGIHQHLDLSNHIEIKYLVVREKVMKLVVSIEHISTKLMIVVTLTKGLSPKWVVEHVAHMDLTNTWDALG
ncbi:hypothetical protein AMTRI_Chr04g251590 [Amborella trichopoda]